MNTINIIWIPKTKSLVKVVSLIDDISINWSDESNKPIYGNDKKVMRIHDVLPRIKRIANKYGCKIIRSY